MRPVVYDLCCGLGGWSKAFIAEGYRAVGFDIENHVYGDARYPGELVLQNILTLHGSQLKDAACIVASPPCTEYSYMAMPWKRAKQIAAALRGEAPFPEDYKGSRNLAELNALFNACFRIQLEASQAAGRHIPMVVENVKGAQPWVGRARANFGSYYLWGDVASVGGRITAALPQFGVTVRAAKRGQKHNPDGTKHGQGSWFAVADSQNRGARKNDGGSWFAIGSLGQAETGQNPVNGRKNGDMGGSWFPQGNGARVEGNHARDGVKAVTVGAGEEYGGSFGWDGSAMRSGNSKSSARKAASAMIAEIPFDLAHYFAKVFKPDEKREETA